MLKDQTQKKTRTLLFPDPSPNRRSHLALQATNLLAEYEPSVMFYGVKCLCTDLYL